MTTDRPPSELTGFAGVCRRFIEHERPTCAILSVAETEQGFSAVALAFMPGGKCKPFEIIQPKRGANT